MESEISSTSEYLKKKLSKQELISMTESLKIELDKNINEFKKNEELLNANKYKLNYTTEVYPLIHSNHIDFGL